MVELPSEAVNTNVIFELIKVGVWIYDLNAVFNDPILLLIDCETIFDLLYDQFRFTLVIT
jgi:hypothetical protein